MTAAKSELTARVTAHRLATYRAARHNGETPIAAARDQLDAAACHLGDTVLETGVAGAWATENYRLARTIREKIIERAGLGSGKLWADKTRSEKFWTFGAPEGRP